MLEANKYKLLSSRGKIIKDKKDIHAVLDQDLDLKHSANIIKNEFVDRNPFSRKNVWKAHFDMIRERVYEKNQNYLAIFTGQTGSGKSYSCMSFARALQSDFSVDRIVFDVKDFFDLITSGELEKGDTIIWEELGISTPSDEWYSVQNKAIRQVLETFRTKNLIVFFNVPFIKFVDSKIRMLFHAHYKARGYNVKRKVGFVSPYSVDYNEYQDKIYYPTMKLKIDGVDVKLRLLITKKIPNSLAKKYEEKRERFLQALIEKHEKEINAQEDVKRLERKRLNILVYREIERLKANKFTWDEIREYLANNYALIKEVQAWQQWFYKVRRDVKALEEKNLREKNHNEL